ncbi:MAG: ABC transporter permease [Clostridia bacterium]
MKQSVNVFLHYRFLLKELVVKGIKLKYRRSYLGILWSLLEPLLTMVVLTLVFQNLLGRSDPFFSIYILTGRLAYSYFSTASKMSMTSIRNNAGMIKKVYVPKYLYPLSSCIHTFIIFIISLIDLFLVMIIQSMPITPYILLSFVPITLLFFFALGTGLIISTIAVFLRDWEYIWDVCLMLIMYTCAIFYKVDDFIGTPTYWIFKLNPLYNIIESFRNCIYGEPMSINALLYSAVFSLVVLIIGSILFAKKQDKFIFHI